MKWLTTSQTLSHTFHWRNTRIESRMQRLLKGPMSQAISLTPTHSPYDYPYYRPTMSTKLKGKNYDSTIKGKQRLLFITTSYKETRELQKKGIHTKKQVRSTPTIIMPLVKNDRHQQRVHVLPK
jgi:hypothetical protein